VPDIPVEETEEIREVAASHGIELVLLVTPTTPVERMKRIAQMSAGFVYLVSVTGGRCCWSSHTALGRMEMQDGECAMAGAMF